MSKKKKHIARPNILKGEKGRLEHEREKHKQREAKAKTAMKAMAKTNWDNMKPNQRWELLKNYLIAQGVLDENGNLIMPDEQ